MQLEYYLLFILLSTARYIAMCIYVVFQETYYIAQLNGNLLSSSCKDHEATVIVIT